jgi:hypothetical protein
VEAQEVQEAPVRVLLCLQALVARCTQPAASPADLAVLKVVLAVALALDPAVHALASGHVPALAVHVQVDLAALPECFRLRVRLRPEDQPVARPSAAAVTSATRRAKKAR